MNSSLRRRFISPLKIIYIVSNYSSPTIHLFCEIIYIVCPLVKLDTDGSLNLPSRILILSANASRVGEIFTFVGNARVCLAETGESVRVSFAIILESRVGRLRDHEDLEEHAISIARKKITFVRRGEIASMKSSEFAVLVKLS